MSDRSLRHIQEPGHTHPEKENSDGKSLKLSASLAVVMKSELQKHRRERQIIDRSFDGNFGEFGPFIWDLWSFELERSASESQPSHFSYCWVQLNILYVNKTASKWF